MTLLGNAVDFMEGVFNNEAAKRATLDYVRFVQDVCLFIFPLFYSISFVWSYAKATFLNFAEKPKFFDRGELLRGLVIWGLIGLYIPIFGSVDYVAHALVKASIPDNFIEFRENQADIIKNKQAAEGDEDGNVQTEDTPKDSSEGPGMLASIGNSIAAALTGALNAFMYAQLEVMGYIVMMIVMLISGVLSKVFFILGPFALLFSILPNNTDKMRKWFNTYLLLLFNPLTCNMLTGFLASLSNANMDSMMSGELGDPTRISDMLIALVVIVCYVLTFWMTSFIIGSADAGKVLSTATQMAGQAGAAMKALGAMTGATKGAGGGIEPMKKATEDAK